VQSVIEVQNVVRRFEQQRRPVLDGLDFKLERGSFAFLTGASGSGKSTLLRLMYGADYPDEGKVTVAGHDLHRGEPRALAMIRRRVAVIFQDFRLLRERSALENVRLVLELRGVDRRLAHRRAMEALDDVGIGAFAKRPVPQLSGGEQQRVAIARALVGDPQVLLCDEPTGNLDEELSMQVLGLIDLASSRGATVLVATHDTEILRRFPHPTFHLSEGKLERRG
jgi:cell division transport system ATP-binding protein